MNFTSELEELIADLYWVSESDETWEIISLDKQPTSEEIAKLSGKNPVTTQDFKQFFHPAVKEDDWHDDEEKIERQKYQSLVKLLQKNLENLTVYKVGKIEVDVFITGKQETGEWIALKTMSVET